MAVNQSAAGPKRVNLICLPYAGGGSSLFHRWQRSLPPSIRVVPAKLPGREARIQEPPLDDLDRLLAELDAMLADAMRQPFVLLGHSMGALVAYAAIVRQRSRNGPMPMGLIVSSCCAPQFLPRKELYHPLDDEQLFQSVLKSYDLSETDADGEAEMIRFLLPTIRADFKVFESYRHQDTPPLSVPIQVIGGADDRYAARHELEAWRDQTTSSFRCRIFPGGHFYFRDHEPKVMDVIAAACARFMV